ncbi:hypothetical protein OS493_040088 [Desmophyllum pertusum]|uniref:Uncharacterized protein n=1 Tax=Desmophyllum pertusum TaxID=174260 RepID=A0A9X0CCB6_9CNID|nr:hypothetical protein OS493_040088 [Desmophyllum pertusum]
METPGRKHLSAEEMHILESQAVSLGGILVLFVAGLYFTRQLLHRISCIERSSFHDVSKLRSSGTVVQLYILHALRAQWSATSFFTHTVTELSQATSDVTFIMLLILESVIPFGSFPAVVCHSASFLFGEELRAMRIVRLNPLFCFLGFAGLLFSVMRPGKANVNFPFHVRGNESGTLYKFKEPSNFQHTEAFMDIGNKEAGTLEPNLTNMDKLGKSDDKSRFGFRS